MTDSAAPLRPVRILLVEDSPSDVALTRAILDESKLMNELVVADDGVRALEILRSADGDTPDLILLDLNLPRMDGREVLAEIKNDPVLRRIPVVVLTTSKAEEDILRSYDLHANCYVSKPLDLEGFVTVVRSIQEFWLSIVRLPRS